MRPADLKTRIFLDSGNPEETKKIVNMLGFLDGQTTNPTLISKNPEIRERLKSGKKITEEEIWNFYKKTAEMIEKIIPKGSISLEVYADKTISSAPMLNKARQMFSWVSNAHIKFPTTRPGLVAAERAVKKGMRVNMTLCFSQEQAAAVYSATLGAERGQVFVSPFIGRLDDIGENGMDLIENIIKMYKKGDGHIEVLTASVRNVNHLLYALKLGSDIVTAPFKVLKEWMDLGTPLPDNNFIYDNQNLKKIPYKKIDLSLDWKEFNIKHELTDKGIERFCDDWNSLIKTI